MFIDRTVLIIIASNKINSRNSCDSDDETHICMQQIRALDKDEEARSYFGIWIFILRREQDVDWHVVASRTTRLW